MTNYTKNPGKDNLIDDIHATRGVLADIARKYGVSNNTVHTWVKKGDLREVVDEARNQTEDFARGKLVELMDGIHIVIDGKVVYKQAPHFGALAFYLKAQAGWSDDGKRKGKPGKAVEALTEAINAAAKLYTEDDE
jgi:hypothetical protein